MPSAAEMRAELKVMRESHPDHVPVSRMKKVDVMGALERMRHITETTPAIAQTKREPLKMEKKAVKMVEPESESDVEEAPKYKKASKKPVASTSKEKAPVKEKTPASKETMKDRMARIRALKKKD